MVKKRTRRRPFTPPRPVDPDGPLPFPIPAICGEGSQTQIDIHTAGSGKLLLFDTPQGGSALRHPELVRLAQKINSILTKEGMTCLRWKRREAALPSLQLTVALVGEEVFLAYALPKEAKAELASARWHLAGGRRRRTVSRARKYR